MDATSMGKGGSRISIWKVAGSRLTLLTFGKSKYFWVLLLQIYRHHKQQTTINKYLSTSPSSFIDLQDKKHWLWCHILRLAQPLDSGDSTLVRF